MQMTIYDAATVGSRSNCVYPNPVTVTDADTMRQAAAFDHVCAAYKQNYRSVDNFLKADCLPMDCDILREYPAGTRVELVRMDDAQAPPVGTKGTVKGVDDTGSLLMRWDNGSGLNVVYGEDVVRKVGDRRAE